jgi:hypothetical protein
MFIMSSKFYDFMKKLVQIIIPAASASYFALAEIWDLPGAEKVTGTLAVVATFLGVVLGISSNTYERLGKGYDGSVVVSTTESGKKLFSLELDGDPEDLEQHDAIRFRVKKELDYS